MVIDEDNLKEIKDSLGKGVGERELKMIELELKNVKRKGDMVGRIGGEELWVLMKGERGEKGVSVEKRIREEVENKKLNKKEYKVYKIKI